ncbi:glycosyltransferase family 39 protein [Nonomuraea typhae]|uniref:glycosyltransferase family 39 protein n=1 Tax=Nonomuraea typhae TaxID=2603600 RepID=UPI0012F7B2FD|nr:glycosyltransferase family 39 protein [Nonomuraea typhae]
MQSSVIDRPTTGPAPQPRRRALRPIWLLAGGWLAQVLLRLWMFRYHTGPVANPDEVGYLLAARLLAGGPGGDYSGSTFYQGGYPLLLTPVYWVTGDPVTVYRLVVVIGSLAAALAFPLAYLVLRRLSLGRRAALALAFVAGLAPSVLVFSGLALVDAVLPTLVLGWLLALHDLLERRSWAAGAVAGALSGLAMTMHLRGTVVMGVFTVTVLASLRRGSLRPGLVALGSGLLTAGAGTLLNGHLKAALYPGGPRDLSGLALDRLTGLDGQLRSVAGALGQLWYLIAATWGLAGIGIAAAVVLVVRSLRRARGSEATWPPVRPRALPVPAGALLALTLGIAYTSSAALPDEHRVGNYVYGRYLACVAVAWTLAGLVVLVRARRRTVLAAAAASAGTLAVSGGLAAWYAGDRLSRYHYIAFDFPETAFLTGVRDRFDMGGASVAALVLLTGITAAAVLRRKAVVLLAAAALAVPNVAFAAGLAPKSAPAAGQDGLPRISHGRVALDTRVSWRTWVHLIHRVHWTELERVNLPDQPIPRGVCTVVAAPEAGAPPAGWRVSGAGQGWVTWSAC